ncbi:hypothetical protein ACS0TY_030278 [Phlomoides rotata]
MDRWKWRVVVDGIFSTKEAYKYQMELGTGEVNEDRNPAFELLWRSAAMRITQAILWKVLKPRLLTKESLRRRGIIQENEDITCRLCGEEEENVIHLFFKCKFAFRVWWNIYQWIGVSMVPHESPIEHLIQHNIILETEDKDRLGASIWIGAT